MVMRLFAERGVRVERTYQLNTGGNTDFLNMLSRERLASKKISKTEAVTSQLPYELGADNVHVGPSDYVPWQQDNKVCFLRVEGTGFGGAPIELEARLSVQDSPNSAGIVIDVIRCGEARARARPRGPAARRLGVQHEAPAGADARQRRSAARRRVRGRPWRRLAAPSCSHRPRPPRVRPRCSASTPWSARRSPCSGLA